MRKVTQKSRQDEMTFHPDPLTPTPHVRHHVFELHFGVFLGGGGGGICLSLYLQGSDWKPARRLGSLCKPRAVYLRGYLQHAAPSAEDESSAGYIRFEAGSQ